MIDKIILFNLEEMVRVAKDNNIKLIFSSYPEYAIHHMEEMSQKYGITFIDLTSVF